MKFSILAASIFALGTRAAITINFYSDSNCQDLVEVANVTPDYTLTYAPAGALSALWVDATSDNTSFSHWALVITDGDAIIQNYPQLGPTQCVSWPSYYQAYGIAD